MFSSPGACECPNLGILRFRAPTSAPSAITFGRVLVKFVGTHAECDRIDPEFHREKYNPPTSLRSGR
jgi:hypothetical protein